MTSSIIPAILGRTCHHRRRRHAVRGNEFLAGAGEVSRPAESRVRQARLGGRRSPDRCRRVG
ncbi:hypothetical protein C2E23DRAFT_851074 [Lenzites betulinus]|nr:hypothetical protein C2E23DRAFT_851074 [Lenzites betulinus]